MSGVRVPHRPLSQIAILRTHPQARESHWIFVGPFALLDPLFASISFTDWLVITIVTDRSTGLDVDDPDLNQVDDDLNLAQSLNDAVYVCRTMSSASPVITFRRTALSARSWLEP